MFPRRSWETSITFTAVCVSTPLRLFFPARIDEITLPKLALPMLPVTVDAKGYLRAKGNFDSQVGPSWWGVRMWKPNP